MSFSFSVLLLFCILFDFSVGSWWLLAMPSANQMLRHSFRSLSIEDYKAKCQRLSYLVDRQKELCTLSQNLLDIVGQGAKMGLEQCQVQFSKHRWNCSTQLDLNRKLNLAKKDSGDVMQSDIPYGKPPDLADLFGDALKLHTREKGFVHAISAAGIAFSITKSCSKGLLPSCSCDENIHRKPSNEGKWEWGGCSDDVAYGVRLSKDFVDSVELAKAEQDPAPKLMNLHNNEAGRMALRSGLKLQCKCHGISGSCSLKMCWRQLIDFVQVGKSLHRRFESAKRVKFYPQDYKLISLSGKKRVKKRDIVFIDDSPDYCSKGAAMNFSKLGGGFGTSGRRCEENVRGPQRCSILCCDRRYDTVVTRRVEKCNCRFVWCCHVKCDLCEEIVEEHFCH